MSASQPTQGGANGAPRGLVGCHGFTLIELMVTVSVIVLIAAVASPAMITLMNSNRLSSTAGELSSAAQLARAEAIRRSAPVVLCGSDDGVACTAGGEWRGWAIVGRNNRDAEEETIRGGLFPANMQLAGPAGGITFNSTGLIATATTLTACIPTDKPADNQRVLTISVAGHVITARDNGGGTCP